MIPEIQAAADESAERPFAQSTTASSTSSLLTVARRTTSRSRYVVFPSVGNPSRCTAFFTSSERKLTLFVVHSSRTTRSVRRSRRPLTTASTSRYVLDVFSVFLLFPFVFADLSLPSLASPHNRSRSLRRWAKSTAWRGSRLPSRCVFVPPCTRCISTFGIKPKHACDPLTVTSVRMYNRDSCELLRALEVLPAALTYTAPRALEFGPPHAPRPGADAMPLFRHRALDLQQLLLRFALPCSFQSCDHCSSGRHIDTRGSSEG